MAATTPRKRAPKKATKPAEVTHMDQFRAYRQRAQGKIQPNPVTVDAYTAGPEKGFDPPVVAMWPTDDMTREIMLIQGMRSIQAAADSSDQLTVLKADVGAILDVLQILFGNDFRRILDSFNQFDDKWALLYGLVEDVMEHFFGVGAADVPGGSGAS